MMTANQDRVKMEVVALIPKLDSNAIAWITILGENAKVRSLLLCILN